MRKEPNLRIENFRSNNNPNLPSSPPNVNYGYFEIKKKDAVLRIISSGTDEHHGWEHVSVSVLSKRFSPRCPTWDEMNYIKKLFWKDDETVIQFHPKKAKYINAMPYCLHLWKKIGEDYELPPSELLA